MFRVPIFVQNACAEDTYKCGRNELKFSNTDENFVRKGANAGN